MKKSRGIHTAKDAYQWGRQSARIQRGVSRNVLLVGSWFIRDEWSDGQKTAFVLGFVSKLGG